MANIRISVQRIAKLPLNTDRKTPIVVCDKNSEISFHISCLPTLRVATPAGFEPATYGLGNTRVKAGRGTPGS